MSVFKSDFLDILYNRGFIHQISDESNLDTLLAHNSPLTAYIGFDATAKSLHAGSLIPIMMLYWFQKTGNRPIVLLGGATSMIGDPSFRDESRKILSPQEIQTNLEGIRKNFTPYLSCGSGPSDALFENNADWLLSLSYIDFLRDIGSHFSVNRMLSFDSVKQRLDREQTLSFLEFNYMILQAYDFKKLFELYGCRLQMGGSDQWGNIINGMELGRRTGTLPLFALTSPLLTTASGAKMGKSGAQTVWLDSNLCSPYNFWQYWRNTEDKDVVRFLHLYTILPLDEINKLAQLKGAEINEAKKILATEITSMLHGREVAEKAESAARETFEEGVIADHLPTLEIPLSTLQEGIGLLSLCVQAGLAQSNSQARRSIREGALRVNNIVILEEESIIKQEHLESDYAITLSLGKKKHVRIRVSS